MALDDRPLTERVRASCDAVMEHATLVRLDAAGLEALAPIVAAAVERPVGADPRKLEPGDEAAVLSVLAMDAINFGSGFHDVIDKEPGLSGNRTMAARLGRWSEPGITVADLRALAVADVAHIFGQSLDRDGRGMLMGWFHTALVDLGNWLEREFGGSAVSAVRAAGRSAERLAELLTAMPLYRDAVPLPDGRAAGEPVSFYKRAQITGADLERLVGPGLFDDLDRLTAFADNLVPHVLRVDGAVSLDPGLAARIDRGRLLQPGSHEEIELRAAGVVAVEQLGAMVGARAMDVDFVLWKRGGSARFKAVPRPRVRSTFY